VLENEFIESIGPGHASSQRDGLPTVGPETDSGR